jgi:hypothetical protein
MTSFVIFLILNKQLKDEHPLIAYHLTLKMEAVLSIETLVDV